ncbi:MAG: hypothetical protein KDC48_05845 [Planctomycetes bacterium]|nr:hypothetical protein [Planctomycetota bacterium]
MATLLRRTLTMLRAPANELSFGLRSRLAWSRGPVALANEAKQELFAHLQGPLRADVEARAVHLREQFGLGALHAASTRVAYAANLALLDRLGALFGDDPVPAGPDGVVRAVDVGCGDFHYATALSRWLARHAGGSRDVVLRGVEVDGHGIYRDGHSRADHARAHAALAAADGQHVTTQVADFRGVRLREQDVVTVFYPFVFAYPLLRWGLPLSQLRPKALLGRAVAALRPGGRLVLASQTAAEFGRAQELLADQPVVLVRTVPFRSDFVPYRELTADRVGSVWQRN